VRSSIFVASLILTIPAALAQTNSTESDRLIAAVQIHSLHKTILGFESSCRKSGSASLGDITRARSVWEQKHAAVLAAANRILATGTPQQRAKLEADIDGQNLAMEQKVESAPKEERTRWCEDFPDGIASATLNPGNSPAYQTLMN
jgi:hypothetical protein